MTEPKHTRLPWKIIPNTAFTAKIIGSTGRTIGTIDHTDEESIANADLIDKCVNEYPEQQAESNRLKESYGQCASRVDLLIALLDRNVARVERLRGRFEYIVSYASGDTIAGTIDLGHIIRQAQAILDETKPEKGD